MYYSFSCPYCSKVFYTYSDNKDSASKMLYDGIKKHLVEYGEDEKEHHMDDGPSADSLEIYQGLAESSEAPSGGYQI